MRERVSREELDDAIETMTDAIAEAIDEASASEALDAIRAAINVLADKALDIYEAHGGFVANAEAYWHAHIKAAANGDAGHATSLNDAVRELEDAGIGDPDDDDYSERGF